MLNTLFTLHELWFLKKRSSFSLQNPCNTIWEILLATLLKLRKENGLVLLLYSVYPDWMKLLITSRGFQIKKKKNKRKQMNKHKTTPHSLFSAIKIQLAGIVALAPSFHFHCAEERVSPSTIILDGKYHSIWLLRNKTGAVLRDVLVNVSLLTPKTLWQKLMA